MSTASFFKRICRNHRWLPPLTGVLFMGPLAFQAADPGRVLAAPPDPNVNATARGNSIHIGAANSLPVAWEIQLNPDKPPSGNPPRFGFSRQPTTRKISSNGLKSSTFTFEFGAVLPGRTYYYIAKSTDDSGQSSYRTGQVQSRTQELTVTFGKIHIIKDGDPEFLRGKGDIDFRFLLNRCPQDGWDRHHSVSDGADIRMNLSQTFFPYTKNYVELTVEGWERDIDFWDFDPSGLPFSGCRLKATPTASESSKYGDSADVSKRIFTHQFVHRQDSATEHVTLETLPTGKLRYRVDVTLSFKYS
jgi:hypothetical protein